MLYPYHKWLLKVLDKAPLKPENLIHEINKLYKLNKLDEFDDDNKVDVVNDFCKKILAFVNIKEEDIDWPNQFLQDSEINWLEHEAPIDDI